MEKRNIIISVQRRNVTDTGFKPPKDLQFAFENQSLIWINPLLNWNKCQFAAKHMPQFSLSVLVHFSENAPNMHFREAKFQIFPEEHAPGPPYSVLAPLALDPILAGPTLNCFRRAWYWTNKNNKLVHFHLGSWYDGLRERIPWTNARKLKIIGFRSTN